MASIAKNKTASNNSAYQQHVLCKREFWRNSYSEVGDVKRCDEHGVIMFIRKRNDVIDLGPITHPRRYVAAKRALEEEAALPRCGKIHRNHPDLTCVMPVDHRDIKCEARDDTGEVWRYYGELPR